MSKETLQKIIDKYGDRATDSKFERSLYSRDLAPVPALLVNPLFKTLPEIVVRPQSSAEVAEILRMACKDGIPVTPRAGASTVYFDSVPVKGGILMDLNLLAGVTKLDEDAMTVKVRAATTWSDLEEVLNSKGLAAKSVPSSAPAATVGGWFCMMGYGIGSIKYGSLLSQVRSIEVVLPDGTIKTVTGETEPALDWFASSEGTLGIITELELEVRKLTEMKHFLLQLPDAGKTFDVMERLLKHVVVPYNLHFSDYKCLQAMDALGFAPSDLNTGFLLEVDYEGSGEELKKAGEIIDNLLSTCKAARSLPEETAVMEWEERYKALKLKRGGPSVLGAEIWLPLNELPAYLDDVQKMSRAYGLDLISYGHVVDPKYATVMTMFYADETRTIKYIINLSLVKKIQDIGYRHQGHPYGTGLWNTPYVRRIHQKPQLSRLRQKKQALDGKGIMNPGKVYRPPLLLNAFNFTVGMNVLAGVRKVLGKGW